VELDMRQAAAVAARIELDLRVGASLTRTQTLGLQHRFDALTENVISYGQSPCAHMTFDPWLTKRFKVPANFPPSASLSINTTRSKTSFPSLFGSFLSRSSAKSPVSSFIGSVEDCLTGTLRLSCTNSVRGNQRRSSCQSRLSRRQSGELYFTCARRTA
jgi:hypothetical protein